MLASQRRILLTWYFIQDFASFWFLGMIFLNPSSKVILRVYSTLNKIQHFVICTFLSSLRHYSEARKKKEVKQAMFLLVLFLESFLIRIFSKQSMEGRPRVHNHYPVFIFLCISEDDSVHCLQFLLQFCFTRKFVE